MSCGQCTDPEGIACFPQYGLGPHSHEASDSAWMHTAKARTYQAVGYTPNPAEDGMGWWWCPSCGDGKPDEVQP